MTTWRIETPLGGLGQLGDGSEVLATAVAAGGVPDEGSRRVAERYGVDLAALIAAEAVRGRPGEVVRAPIALVAGRGRGAGGSTGATADAAPKRWLLVGVGEGAGPDLRRAGAALGRSVRGSAGTGTLATSLLAGRPAAAVRAGVEGLLLGGWTPPAQGVTSRSDSRPVGEVVLAGRVAAHAVELGRIHGEATLLARRLAVTPSSTKDPAWMVEQAHTAAREGGLRVDTWDVHRLARDGFGGLLTVGGGSARPPALVRLEHVPPGTSRSSRPIVLIGKGITFDTGGISLKPREAMVPMKTDMSGAAAVLATLAACRAAGVRRRVIGLLPLAENMIGASAYRPADVVRHYGGRTVEVGNTDAEGRLVLADALAYADARLDPEVVVDVATLTGAATFALGRRHGALFSTDDGLGRSLRAAGEAAGEALWPMPLVADYAPALRSDVADLRQEPSDASVGAGAITAALFLQSFAGRRRWAHLDIAGVARSDKDEHEVCKGATGFGARLLLRWLAGVR